MSWHAAVLRNRLGPTNQCSERRSPLSMRAHIFWDANCHAGNEARVNGARGLLTEVSASMTSLRWMAALSMAPKARTAMLPSSISWWGNSLACSCYTKPVTKILGPFSTQACKAVSSGQTGPDIGCSQVIVGSASCNASACAWEEGARRQ